MHAVANLGLGFIRVLANSPSDVTEIFCFDLIRCVRAFDRGPYPGAGRRHSRVLTRVDRDDFVNIMIPLPTHYVSGENGRT